MSIATRLSKLEEAMHPKRVIVVWQNYDEPESAALARWSAARPNEPPPNETDTTVYLIKWGDPE